MSGHSDCDTCPNCGKQADVYYDRKPFNLINYNCCYCGLVIYPAVSYFDLEELNQIRSDQDLEPLKELPKQKFHT